MDQLETELDILNNDDVSAKEIKSVPIWLCLKLLTYKYTSEAVRKFAIRNLKRIDNKMLRPLMTALVQVSKCLIPVLLLTLENVLL